MPIFWSLLETVEQQQSSLLDLLILGFVFWIFAYALIVIKGFQDKTYGIPYLAICLNLAWEFYFSFVALDMSDSKELWLLRSWFFLDLIIFHQLLRWGRDWETRLYLRRHFRLFILALLVYAYLGETGFMAINFDTNGTEMAWINNLIMSVLFIGFFFQRPNSEGLSYPAAWLKMLGSAAMGIVLFKASASLRSCTGNSPTNNYDFFLKFLVVSVFALDMIYIALLTRRRRERSVEDRPDDPR